MFQGCNFFGTTRCGRQTVNLVTARETRIRIPKSEYLTNKQLKKRIPRARILPKSGQRAPGSIENMTLKVQPTQLEQVLELVQ